MEKEYEVIIICTEKRLCPTCKDTIESKIKDYFIQCSNSQDANRKFNILRSYANLHFSK